MEALGSAKAHHSLISCLNINLGIDFDTHGQPCANNIKVWFINKGGGHFHGVVHGDGEDLTVLGGDAEVADGSLVASQNSSWFPGERKRKLKRPTFPGAQGKPEEFIAIPHPEKCGFHMRTRLSRPPVTNKLCFPQRSNVLTPLLMLNAVWSCDARSCGVQLS